MSVLWVLNDNLLKMEGLRDANGAYQNSATVSLISLVDKAGVTVTGITLPLALAYVAASNGEYRATIQDTANLVDDVTYIGIVTVDSGGLQARMSIETKARTRMIV